MDRSLEKIEKPNKESGVPNLWTSLHGLPLQMSGYSTWAIRITTLMLTIALGFLNESEVHRCIVAMVLHAVACVVTTFVITWNNQETMDSLKKGCELWFMNFLFLTETMTLHNSNQKPDSNDEIRESLWGLERNLKQTYTRLCVCFFTNIPSALLQSYFMFQSEATVNEEYWYWLYVIRFVFIATTIFDAAITVTTYERYTREYTIQLYELDKSGMPSAQTDFRFCRIFLLQFIMITQWVYTSTVFLTISRYHVSMYVLSLFIRNYVILKLIPEVEQPYVNAPHGVHTVESFWTKRIINTISSVGTRLNQCPYYVFNGLGGESIFRRILLLLPQLQLEGVVFMFIHSVLFDVGLTSVNQKYLVSGEFGVLVFFFIFVFTNLGDIVLFEYGFTEPEIEGPYPVITGYAFYSVLLEHVCEQSRDSLLFYLRTLMVTSLAVRVDFYKHYRELVNDRELTVQKLTDHFIDDLDIDENLDELIGELSDLRKIILEESYPFVHEFDEFTSAIHENENEEEKLKDLKLLYAFYNYFDVIVDHLSSDKILKIFEVMGVGVRKGDEILENKEWVFL